MGKRLGIYEQGLFMTNDDDDDIPFPFSFPSCLHSFPFGFYTQANNSYSKANTDVSASVRQHTNYTRTLILKFTSSIPI